MTCPFKPAEPATQQGAGRRSFLTGGVCVAGGFAIAASMRAQAEARPAAVADNVIAFHGAHQAGILTPSQSHTYFAAFDVTAANRAQLADLLRAWTDAAARLTAGLPCVDTAVNAATDAASPAADSGDAIGLKPSRLTLTFGFGPDLFSKNGADRYGLARHRPAALADLPRFVGDQLVPARTGGDLSVQACSDDPQVNLHAIRQLMRLSYGVASLRWVQNGFLSGGGGNATPRNLMGFKDGTMNPDSNDPALMARVVWAGRESGAWMSGGSYAVARIIRIALQHWDRMTPGFQEQTIGRLKSSGAPIGGAYEFTPIDLDATGKDGNPLIAENAHVRLAAPAANDGAQILRRSYSYDNGVSFTAERWPPWRQGMELDAGLLFICYQRDPRNGFTKIFDRLSKFDMMNQFVTHTGGGLFACPPGAAPGGYIGQALFEMT